MNPLPDTLKVGDFLYIPRHEEFKWVQKAIYVEHHGITVYVLKYQIGLGGHWWNGVTEWTIAELRNTGAMLSSKKEYDRLSRAYKKYGH